MPRKSLRLEPLGRMQRVQLRRHVSRRRDEEPRGFRPSDRDDFIVVPGIHPVKHEWRKFSDEMGWRFPNVRLISVRYGDESDNVSHKRCSDATREVFPLTFRPG